AVRGAHEGRDDLDVPLLDLGSFAPEVGEAEVDIQLEEVDSAWALGHAEERRQAIGQHKLGAWASSVLAPPTCQRRQRPPKQCPNCAGVVTRPASLASSAVSGWTMTAQLSSARPPELPTSSSPCTRRWPRSWAMSTTARSSRWRSECSTTPPASPRPRAPS